MQTARQGRALNSLSLDGRLVKRGRTKGSCSHPRRIYTAPPSSPSRTHCRHAALPSSLRHARSRSVAFHAHFALESVASFDRVIQSTRHSFNTRGWTAIELNFCMRILNISSLSTDFSSFVKSGNAVALCPSAGHGRPSVSPSSQKSMPDVCLPFPSVRQNAAATPTRSSFPPLPAFLPLPFQARRPSHRLS